MRAQQRKEFSHRGRLYRVLGYETGGRVLKRRDNGVWTVVVAPSYGLLQCMEQALGGQGAADRWRASPVVSFNQGAGAQQQREVRTMDQTQQQTTDQPQVQWGPGQRTGQVLSTHTLEGEEFSVTRSDGWHERTDLPPGHYQRDEVPGKTRPCILTIRSKDLKPAEPAPVKPERAAGLREDLATALASVRAALDGDLPEMARLQLVNAERDLMGALAQVAG